MYQSILVPLDISPLSQQALPVALSIARRSGAALQLVYVAHQHLDTYQDADSQAHTYLESCAAPLRDAGCHTATVVLIRNRGSAQGMVDLAAHDRLIARALHDHALATDVDLVVMTSHSRGEVARLWLGSVADKLVRKLAVPILLVRPQQPALSIQQDQVFSHVLIPLDGSPQAETVIEHALMLLELTHARCTLLRAIDPLLAGHTAPPYAEGLTKQEVEQLQAEARAYLARMAERIRPQALGVQTRVVVGEPAQAIIAYAEEHAVDLIAIATHGRRMLSKMILGSTAASIVRNAHAHVLLYRPS